MTIGNDLYRTVLHFLLIIFITLGAVISFPIHVILTLCIHKLSYVHFSPNNYIMLVHCAVTAPAVLHVCIRIIMLPSCVCQMCVSVSVVSQCLSIKKVHSVFDWSHIFCLSAPFPPPPTGVNIPAYSQAHCAA
jgi:hypothetical protein